MLVLSAYGVCWRYFVLAAVTLTYVTFPYVSRQQTAFVAAQPSLQIVDSTRSTVPVDRRTAMLSDIVRTYADAMYVATTLRLPEQAPPSRESDHVAHRAESGRVPLLDRLVG